MSDRVQHQANEARNPRTIVIIRNTIMAVEKYGSYLAYIRISRVYVHPTVALLLG